MDGAEPGELYLPGVHDGAQVRRAELVLKLRAELRRFELTVSESFNLLPLRGHARLPEPPAGAYDNPQGDPDYDRGFTLGRAATNDECVAQLGPILLEFGLMLGDEGTVTTREVGMRIISAFRKQADHARNQASAPPLTDQALHAFLDGAPPAALATTPAADNSEDDALEAPLTSPTDAASGSPVSATTAQTLASASSSETPMPPRRTNRRLAMATILGTFLAGIGASTFAGRMFSEAPTPSGPTSKPSPTAQLPTGPWVPPTTWDNYPTSFRAEMLAIDQYVHSMLSQGREAELVGLVSWVLANPVAPDIQKRVISYSSATRRVGWMSAVAGALVPASGGSADEDVQAAALAQLRLHAPAIRQGAGRQAVLAAVQAALAQGRVSMALQPVAADLVTKLGG